MSSHSSASSVTTGAANHGDEIASGSGGVKWLIMALILSVFASLAYKGCMPVGTTEVALVSEEAVMPVGAEPTVLSKESVKVKLPNGKELDAFKGGIEDQLVTFLNGGWKSMSDDLLKNKWFDFDNLNFNSGKATLLPESEKQLDNIAEILKAFPAVKFKIGGYTDASGDSAANKTLSQGRADAAKSGLVKRGVGEQVAGAEGYGAGFAKFPATASEAERLADRRVSISVRK